MTCTECGTEHPWYASACGAPVEYSDADRQLQALLQGPERDVILSWMLDQYLGLQSAPRSGGPRENVSQWLQASPVGAAGPVEAYKSYCSWCRSNDSEQADPRDFVEEFERITGRSFAQGISI